MLKHLLLLMIAFLQISLTPAQAASASEADKATLWTALQSGGYVILMRHAITEPGIGDPPGFTLGACSTQRNLSSQGREDATRIGEALRRHEVPIAEVLSSRWCRCIDTARLAFGRVTPAPMLDSMFNDAESMREKKLREVFAAISRHEGRGNLVLVTHAVNIQALTGLSPSSGEMIVVSAEGPQSVRVIGRLKVPNS